MRMTLVHMNYQANPASMHLRAHSLALKWAQNGATLVRRNCQDYYYPRHGADADDDVINQENLGPLGIVRIGRYYLVYC